MANKQSVAEEEDVVKTNLEARVLDLERQVQDLVNFRSSVHVASITQGHYVDFAKKYHKLYLLASQYSKSVLEGKPDKELGEKLQAEMENRQGR